MEDARRRRGRGPNRGGKAVRGAREDFSGLSKGSDARAWAIPGDRDATRRRSVGVYFEKETALDMLLGTSGSVGTVVTIEAMGRPIGLTAAEVQPIAVLMLERKANTFMATPEVLGQSIDLATDEGAEGTSAAVPPSSSGSLRSPVLS